MKKIIVLIVFIAIMINGLFAQQSKLYWIGLNASASKGELIRYGGKLDGGLGYTGKIGYLIGIGFSRVINDRFNFETGIDYSRNSFNSSYTNEMGQSISSPNAEQVDLLTIPLNLKITIKKHFFITGGIQYDQRFNVINSPTIDNQTGIGFNLKFGRSFKITDKMIFNISPEILTHDIIPFYAEKHQQRMTEFGLRVSYKFGL
jgi:hypothetical protein